MAKVMKAKPRDAMLFRKARKLSGEIVRVHPFAQLVHEHISIKGIVIAVAADFFVDLLRLFDLAEVFRKTAYKGECAQAGFCLGGVLLQVHELSVKIHRGDGAADGDGAMFKIDGIPFLSQHFTTPQTVKCRHQYRQLQPCVPHGFKQIFQFFCIEEDGLISILAWPVHLCRNILHHQIHLYSIFQCLIDDSMVMDDRICLYFPQFFRIKALQVPCLQLRYR